MSKPIVFLIHGVGDHSDSWAFQPSGPVETLVEAANRYSGFSVNDPLTNSLEFVEIRYDDIFDRILKRWNTLADNLTGLPGATPKAIGKVTEAIGSFTEPGQTPFASHVMDVVFYRGFALVRRLVQLAVASRMAQTLAEFGPGRQYAVIAHSLGTAVAHDAIHRLASARWLSDNSRAARAMFPALGDDFEADAVRNAIDRFGSNPFGPGKLTFRAIFMLANTSNLLHGDTPSPQCSLTRPRGALPDPHQYMCEDFYNVYHRLDPITLIRRFHAEDLWPETDTAHDLSLDHIHDLNVHGFGHYLMHPSVHGRLFGLLLPFARFSNEDYRIAVSQAGFAKHGEGFRDEDVRETLRIQLGGLLDQMEIKHNSEGLVALYHKMGGLREAFLNRFRN